MSNEQETKIKTVSFTTTHNIVVNVNRERYEVEIWSDQDGDVYGQKIVDKDNKELDDGSVLHGEIMDYLAHEGFL
ncbi:MAG: hypothetical protein Q8O88_00745 [bacterium]|nr:hypothetical protein [bacterium]